MILYIIGNVILDHGFRTNVICEFTLTHVKKKGHFKGRSDFIFEPRYNISKTETRKIQVHKR